MSRRQSKTIPDHARAPLERLEAAAKEAFGVSPRRPRPILFSDPMVRAILARQKRVTRRVINLAHAHEPDFYDSVEPVGGAFEARFGGAFTALSCPFGRPGDHLWVREAWAPADRYVDCFGYDRDPPAHHVYRADGMLRVWFEGRPPEFRAHPQNGLNLQRVRWRPSIHMPLSASRLLLTVLEVSAARLHDIDPDECAAEGITFSDVGPVRCWIDAFRDLWNRINTDRGFGWDLNPWVWRVRFAVVRS